MYVIEKAVKAQLKARMVIEGPAGSGKTMTSLIMAKALGAKNIVVADTQRRQSLHYASRFDFSVMHLNHFHPDELVKVCAAAAAGGHDALIIDSGSSFWSGRGGVLAQVDASSGEAGGKFGNGWKNIKPAEERMLDALLSYPGHVLMTLRVKSDYVIETKSNGREGPRKVGMKPDQRDMLDYEFDFVGTMDDTNTLTFSKSPCLDLQGTTWATPDETVGEKIAEWLGLGVVLKTAAEIREQALDKNITVDDLLALKAEAAALNLLGTAMLDEHGDSATLHHIINRKGREAQARENGVAQ